jgi:hypothetical protein
MKKMNKKVIAILFAVTLVITCLPTLTIAESQAVIYVWQDTDGDGVKDAFLGSVLAYSGSDTGAANYNFYSDSAHPIAGPTPVGYETKMYFYEGSDGLSFGMFHNVDEGGSASNTVLWDLDITGTNPDVFLSDDSGELSESSSNHFDGDWIYGDNTDGGVIGELDGDTWDIVITPILWGDITTWDIYTADGSSINLNKDYTTYLTVIPPPAPVPTLMPIGIIALVGLLSVVAAMSIRRKK